MGRTATVSGPSDASGHAERGVKKLPKFRMSLRSGAEVVVYGWRSVQTSGCLHLLTTRLGSSVFPDFGLLLSSVGYGDVETANR